MDKYSDLSVLLSESELSPMLFCFSPCMMGVCTCCPIVPACAVFPRFRRTAWAQAPFIIWLKKIVSQHGLTTFQTSLTSHPHWPSSSNHKRHSCIPPTQSWLQHWVAYQRQAPVDLFVVGTGAG